MSGSHARLRKPSAQIVALGKGHRDAIQASMILKRLTAFIKIDPDRPSPDDVRMTRTQVHAALALLKKILPDLASVEVSGNPEKPLMVQVVRFSDGEEIAEPRAVLDMGKVIEMDREEQQAIKAEARSANSQCATRSKPNHGREKSGTRRSLTR